MVLVPMKDAREWSLAKFYDTCFGTYRIQSQGLRSFVDTKHRNPFGCGKIEFRQRVQGVLPAEKSTYHLQAGDTALHAVMLVNNLNITHKQLQY